MFIQLFICSVLIEEIEVDYYDCLNDEDKRKRNLCYAGHLKEKHFNKKVVFSKEWEIYLSAESKMNYDVPFEIRERKVKVWQQQPGL